MEKEGKDKKGRNFVKIIRQIILYIVIDGIAILFLTHCRWGGSDPMDTKSIPIILIILLIINYFHFDSK